MIKKLTKFEIQQQNDQEQDEQDEQYEQRTRKGKMSKDKCFPIIVVVAHVSILPPIKICSPLCPLAIPKFQLLVQSSSAKPL